MRIHKNSSFIEKLIRTAISASTPSVSTGALAAGSYGGGHGHDFEGGQPY